MITDFRKASTSNHNGHGQRNGHHLAPYYRVAALSQAPPAIPVSVISNSRLICEGLPVLLSEYLALRVVDCYGGEPVTTRPLPNPDGHLVLLDSGVGARTAAAWTAYWRDRADPARVLLLELADDVEQILACVEAGASGYTLRGASPREIAETIHLLAEGKTACSPRVAARLFERVRELAARTQSLESRFNPLTVREVEVLERVALGHSNEEIAADLVITLRTVKHHIHNILRKLDAPRRGEAARVARQRGWIGPSPNRARPA